VRGKELVQGGNNPENTLEGDCRRGAGPNDLFRVIRRLPQKPITGSARYTKTPNKIERKRGAVTKNL